MRRILMNVFENVSNGIITPEEGYTEFMKLKQDLYSILAEDNGLVEVGFNEWVMKKRMVEESEFLKTTYYLTKLGFQTKHEHKKPTFMEKLFKLY